MKFLDYGISDKKDYLRELRVLLKAKIIKSEKEYIRIGKENDGGYVMLYDFENVKEDLLKFDESYSIAMYIIIEFLARRRNTKTDNQLFYMNQYFTVESEYQTFKEIPSQKDNSIDANKMKEEDQIFKSRNIIFNPDNNIDKMLEDLYTILNR